MSLISVAKAAYSAGFRGQSLVTAVAIAGAESFFDNSAIGDVDLQNDKWGPSVGAWQIRTLKTDAYNSVPPGSVDRYRNYNSLLNLDYNASAAYAISKQGTDFGPWSTYTNGAYTKFLVDVQSQVTKLGDSIKSSPIQAVLTIIAIIAAIIFLKKMFS